MLRSGGFVVLDTEVTAELAREGMARDLIRGIQQARRDAGLDVSDRIALTIAGGEAVRDAAGVHAELIGAETLAVAYVVTDRIDGTSVSVGEGEAAFVAIAKR
jgi:isoleucyl-tRNA synthetase